VSKGDKSANAKSINQVVTLAVRRGAQIVLKATGPDAAGALAALQALAENNFGDVDEEPLPASLRAEPQDEASPPLPSRQPAQYFGRFAAGMLGPVFHYRPQLPEFTVKQVADVAAEWLDSKPLLPRRRWRSSYCVRRAKQRRTEASIFEAHNIRKTPLARRCQRTHL
jgi:phosphocarrier protein FPr